MVYPISAFGNQPSQPGVGLESNKSALTKVALGAGAITAGGFISTSKGRLWDKYISGIRAVESGSPGGVLKTFRLSEFLSPLESYSTIHLPEDTFFGGKYAEFLRASFGEVKELSFKRTGAIFGEATDEAGKVVGYGLQIKAGTQKSTAIADYAARIRGLIISENQSLNDSLLRTEYRRLKPLESYNEWFRMMEPELRQRRLIIGAKLRSKVNVLGKDLQLSEAMSRRFAKLEAGSLLLRAKAASTAGRLNTLLTAPFDLPIVKDIAKRVPFFRTMAVQPGSNLEIMARLTKKGIYAGLAWKGLEYADYLRSEGSPLAPVALTGLGMGFGNLLARRPGMMFSKAGLLVGGLFGAAASVAPRFDEGLFYGAATLGTDASLARASFSQSIGLTESLQRQEELTPGLMNPGTLLAAGGIASLATGMWTYGGMIKKALINKEAGRSVANAIDAAREIARSEGLEKLWKSSIGSKIAKTPLLKNLTKIKSPMTLGFFAGAATMGVAASALALASGNIMAAMPFAGVLGTTETPEELQQIYSGEKEVAVRKGRYWEMGRSVFKGGRIDYYRQHMLPRLKSRAYEKGLYNSEEERWAHDPFLHPLKALFGDDEWKYWYAQKYQKERPAPISGTYGEDIPFIGPLIAATVGKLFKPRKLIRPEEWATESGFVHRPDVRGEQEPAYHLGGLAPGAPVAPDDPTQLLNELNYRRREAVGLIGFAEGSLTKALIGREEFLPNKETLAAMGKETGSEYWLWKHLNLGGALFASEPVRRFIPRTRSYLETYNPLKADVPSWYPKDYFLDAQYGNLFERIPEYELRGPGAGYAALHPDVEGLSPEEYPLAHRVKILGDLFYYSDEYRNTLSFAKKHIENMSSQHAKIVLETERQVREKKKRTELEEYRFRSEELSREQVTISDVISPSRFKTKEYGDLIAEAQGIQRVEDKEAAMNMAKDLVGQKISLYTPAMESRKFSSISGAARVKAVPIVNGETWASLLESEGAITRKPYKDEFEQLEYSTMERLVGGASEKLLHGLETPLEFLTPLSPASKLISQRSAIEEYAASRAHGTLNAFWDRPVENFISPAISMTAHKMGATSIPENIQEKRDIQEHYDMLKWVKSSRLESLARQRGDLSEAAEFKRQKESTVFGMDVFKSPVNIIKALPRNERDFFGAFSAAKTEEDRQKILDMVPENEKRIYLSQWLRQEESAAYAKRKAKLDTEEDNNIINLASLARKSEGFGFGDVEQEQWLQETGGRIAFDDYLRERKAEEYFSTHSLPDPEWLGWSPAVDLDDVKMVEAEMNSTDFHDLDLWDQRKRSLARKPYINPELVEDMQANAEYEDAWKVARNSKTLAKMYDDNNAEVQILQMGANVGEDKYNITIMDDRKELVEKAYKQLGM